jgi:hypothetical protein
MALCLFFIAHLLYPVIVDIFLINHGYNKISLINRPNSMRLISIFKIVLLLALISLAGCTPPSRSYDKTELNFKLIEPGQHNIDRIKPRELSVEATRPWTNSGIFVSNGDIVTAIASGTWSPWTGVASAGPDGNVAFAYEVPGINGSALIARIGHNGQPFKIGIEQTFQASDYGMLYFAMNDAFNFLHDNSGSVQVEVYIDAPQSAANDALRNIVINSYSYDDKKQRGSISAKVNGDSFVVRDWLLKKIGEIASSKNVAIRAGNEQREGGSYKVLNENIEDSVLSMDFETLF